MERRISQAGNLPLRRVKGGSAGLEWYQLIFELIDMRSFSNLWYWIMLAVMWSSASHWVLGVPFDMIARARRHGDQAQADLETIVRINTGRLLNIARVSGSWLIGFLFFGLTVLGVLGFLYNVEFARALLCLVVPMSVLMGLSIRSAGLIEAGESSGAALQRRLSRHRLATQLLGMVSIFITSLYGMWENLHISVLG
jgi:hypothetical protein